MTLLESIVTSLMDFLTPWLRCRRCLAASCLLLGCAGTLGGWHFAETKVLIVSLALSILGIVGLAIAQRRR